MNQTLGWQALALPSEMTSFAGAYVRREPSALSCWPRHPAHEADWEARLKEVSATPPAREVWERVASDGRRLGADDVVHENCELLGSGEALCVTTGQQPGLFLGPLYTVYKAMTAVMLARRLSERTGREVVPVFWNAADDSDFGEVQAAFLPSEGFRLMRVALGGAELVASGMVGDLATLDTRRALEEAKESFQHQPSAERVLEGLEAALARAADHGELASALLYDFFRGTGLVVVDARARELRSCAAPLFERYARAREEASLAVSRGARELEALGFGARIAEGSSRNALFDIRDGRRLPFTGTPEELLARIAEEPETLSPNVTLRPLVQDFLFPNVATVCGSSEIHYHAQLRREYDLLRVGMPLLLARFEATLVPPGVYALADKRGVPLGELVRDFDKAMRASAERTVPERLSRALDSLESSWRERAEDVRREAEAFEEKLGAAVSEASSRALAATEKLREKLAQAARAAEARRDPAVRDYREFLKPRGLPQERVLSALTLFLSSSANPLECLKEPIESHLTSVREGKPMHFLLELGGRRGGLPS